MRKKLHIEKSGFTRALKSKYFGRSIVFFQIFMLNFLKEFKSFRTEVLSRAKSTCVLLLRVSWDPFFLFASSNYIQDKNYRVKNKAVRDR